jgi:hypothetical protein
VNRAPAVAVDPGEEACSAAGTGGRRHAGEAVMNGTTKGRGSAQYAAEGRRAGAGHDACQGFCPVCGAVAPCYRNRRDRACP